MEVNDHIANIDDTFYLLHVYKLVFNVLIENEKP